MFKFTDGFVKTWKPNDGKTKDFYKPRVKIRVHPKGNITVTIAVKRQGVGFSKVIGKFADNKLDKQQLAQLNDSYRKWFLILEDETTLPQDIIDREARAKEKADREAGDAYIDNMAALGQMDSVIEDYLSRHVSSLKTANQIERMYAPRQVDWEASGDIQYIDGVGGCLGQLRELMVTEFTRSALIDILRGIDAQVMQNRARSQVMKLGSWMVENDYIESNPATNLPKNKEPKRHTILTDSDIKKLWPLLSTPLRFALATGQRRSEIASMKWSDIQGDVWVQADTKSGVPHSLKLPKFALGLLPERAEGFVWKSDRAVRLNESTLTHHWKEASDQAGLETRLHDARRTAGTNIAALMGSAEAADKVLNHAMAGVTSRYVLTDFGDVKAEGLRRWCDRLAEIV